MPNERLAVRCQSAATRASGDLIAVTERLLLDYVPSLTEIGMRPSMLCRKAQASIGKEAAPRIPR